MFQQEIINEIVEKALAALDWKKDPQSLYDPVEYILGLGGKHLRPRLCLTAYNLFSDNINQAAVCPALALEIFHQFTLLHDDIMDKSDKRRGMPTVHCKWNDNAAILSGDVMSILAYRYLAKCPADKLPAVLGIFTDMAVAVCEGQQKDMDFEKMPFITMDDYINMISQKTGALIAASACLGATVAGASDAACRALFDYGMNIGIAFQITDDFLDTYGDAKIFGKPIGGDIANNKKTWLLVESMHRCVTESQKSRLEAVMATGVDRKQEKFDAMKAIYDELGVREDAAKAILNYYDAALKALEGAGLDQDRLNVLAEFAGSLIHREK